HPRREPSSMPHERRQVLYGGRVQGVGFRFTARDLAKGFPVSGYVRNLSDGRVEVVAEGEPPDLSSFLDAIAREMSDSIQDADVEVVPIDDPLPAGFTIRF